MRPCPLVACRQSIATGGVLSRSFQSDAAGNVTDDDLVSPATTKDYIYNAAGQLASASVNSTAAGAYVYDSLSRLVECTAGAVTLHRVHDLDGNVVAEYDDTGALLTGPASQSVFYKDKKGDIYVKNKRNLKGPGDPTGLNINDF